MSFYKENWKYTELNRRKIGEVWKGIWVTLLSLSVLKGMQELILYIPLFLARVRPPPPSTDDSLSCSLSLSGFVSPFFFFFEWKPLQWVPWEIQRKIKYVPCFLEKRNTNLHGSFILKSCLSLSARISSLNPSLTFKGLSWRGLRIHIFFPMGSQKDA